MSNNFSEALNRHHGRTRRDQTIANQRYIARLAREIADVERRLEHGRKGRKRIDPYQVLLGS